VNIFQFVFLKLSALFDVIIMFTLRCLQTKIITQTSDRHLYRQRNICPPILYSCKIVPLPRA